MSWDVEIVKASDESVSSSITLQDDDELAFATIAGAVYDVELEVVFASPAGAGTPDIKFALGEDTSNRGVFHIYAVDTTDGNVTTGSPIVANQDNAAPGNATAGTAAANRGALMRGVYYGGGGTFHLQWAQATSSVNATIVRAGSRLRFNKLVSFRPWVAEY